MICICLIYLYWCNDISSAIIYVISFRVIDVTQTIFMIKVCSINKSENREYRKRLVNLVYKQFFFVNRINFCH